MMLGLRRGSLFQRTATTVAGVSLLFLVITIGAIAYFILIPTGQRSADDLAALIELAANSWHKLPEERQAQYAARLEENYHLRISTPAMGMRPIDSPMPYFIFLEQSLTRRLGHRVPVLVAGGESEPGWYWVRLRLNDGDLVVGFRYVHEGMEPPVLLVLLMGLGGLLTLLTSLALAHRVLRPLERLAEAARDVGCGGQPTPLPEQGPSELADLARTFNRMALQVQDLIANRTTLLAGISHDLRTPLARIQLALEMLPESVEDEMVDAIRRDIDQMNRLIGLFLEISRGLQAEQRQRFDVMALLDEVVGDVRRGGHPIIWQRGPSCERLLHPLALRRIVTNLVENAVRYGGPEPVEVYCHMQGNDFAVEVLDKGPGIPEGEREAVFRPFHRLEQSRSRETGGSGLGLSIARQLANANGCTIRLLGREGGGTRALVLIPDKGSETDSCSSAT